MNTFAAGGDHAPQSGYHGQQRWISPDVSAYESPLSESAVGRCGREASPADPRRTSGSESG
jgi:hypothetical protein